LDTLVNASTSFSAAILQQLAAVQSDQTPGELAEKTIAYATAKTAYYQALRAAAPVLVNIATGKEPRPPESDKFAAAFSVAGEKQEKAADEETAILLKRFLRTPGVDKGSAEFERAQRVEEWL
jgi:hypothetical protein